MTLNKIVKAKLNQYFKQRLGMFDYRNGWMKGNCPDCGKEFKFGVNLSKNRTHCFVCEYSKMPIDVVVEVEGLESRFKAWHFLKAFEGIEYLEPRVVQREVRDVKLPESFTLISLGNSFIAKSARNYWKGRGFNITQSALNGIGYCSSGTYAYRIIIPYHVAGKLIYFTARQFYDFGPKFKNPDVEEFGIGKSQLIYNIDALAIYNKIYVVESITNALTLGDSTIAIGGKHISNWQLSTLISSPCSKLVILLDPDAHEESIKLGLSIALYKKVKVVKLPDETDVNTLGKKETIKYIKDTPYKSYRELKTELNERSWVTYI